MTNDIICSVPWHCGDRDCEAGWHLGTYWITEIGYSYDEFSDGDHEDILMSDLPTTEEEGSAWFRYAEHVAETGEDPLGQYFVKREHKKMRTWQVDIVRTVGGLRLCLARRNGRGKWLPSHEIPQVVLDYFLVVGDRGAICRETIPDIETLRNFAAEDDDVLKIQRGRYGELGVRILLRIEESAPRATRTVAKELRKAARRHMRQIHLCQRSVNGQALLDLVDRVGKL